MTVTIKVKGSSLTADKINPLLTLGYSMDRASGANIIDMPGRVNPVVVFRPVKGRKGKISVLLADEAAAAAFDLLLARQLTYTFSDTDRSIVGMDFVLDVGGFNVELDEDTRDVFIGTMQVVEQ